MPTSDAEFAVGVDSEAMDFLFSLPLPVSLAVLALLDGLSVGTLLIPLFLLIAPGRVRTGRVLLYLATITAFYLGIGILFTLGLVNIIEPARTALQSTGGQILVLIAGFALLLTGIALGVVGSRRRTEAAGVAPARGRLLRWRTRLLDERASGAAVAGVAIAAGTIELAGMLPYVVGMTMLADAPIAAVSRAALLAGYCVVMVLPALLLLVARIQIAERVEAPLQRFTAWMQRTGSENTAWILGLLGFLLARMAANNLGVQLPLIG
ncbi:Sap-like sulfolipid-1-addressing protein [Leucobacter luti]|uniref:Sap-like sulfolipid-1-addressing protein n=1 Tax=Leucobacter luti TaxID=340320 RepID=A0A4V3CYJ1_9MICO|nr:GAP family protein [Leucobacter luti]TDP94368.1 Sap-like sulfolipid-1-addressing protein [Leucobacter luti]